MPSEQVSKNPDGTPVIKIPCEVYSKIVGYLRPVQDWHTAKQQEFEDRVTFEIPEEALDGEVSENPDDIPAQSED